MQLCAWIACVLVTLCQFIQSDGARILILCDQIRSHQSVFSVLADGLVKNGHEVIWLLSDQDKFGETLRDSSQQLLTYSNGNVDFDADEISDLTERESRTMKTVFDKLSLIVPQVAEAVLMENEEAMRHLEDMGLDYALVDGFMMTKYKFLIAHRLSLPVVAVSDGQEPWHARVPWLPSFVPLCIGPFTEKMTFIERVQNLFLYAVVHFRGLSPSLPGHVIRKYQEFGQFDSIDEISRNTKLWLITSDPVIDYAKPMMPHMVDIGGITTKPAKPLDSDWGIIMDSAHDHGVVLVSFGGASFPTNTLLKLLKTFSMLPQTVIWRFSNADNLEIPKNVIVANQLPQNDLMAHPNMEALVTNCGSNNQYDALYHGVPMVCAPLQNDQFYNAKRIAHKKFGVAVDIGKFDPVELTSAINEVISNPVYRENISKASLIFQDRPDTPSERAIAAIERLIQFGGDHLHTHASDMPLHQFLMLDVLALIMIFLLAVLFVVAHIISMCWSFCFPVSNIQRTKLKSQ